MLPCTALDNFNQCNGFSFLLLPLFELKGRVKPRPFALPGKVNGGGEGEPGLRPPLPGRVGGGGAEGRAGGFCVGGGGAEGTVKEFFVRGGGGGAEGMSKEFLLLLICLPENFEKGGACGGTRGEGLGPVGCRGWRGGDGGGGGIALIGGFSRKGGVDSGGGINDGGGVCGALTVEDTAKWIGESGGGGGGDLGDSLGERVMLLHCE